MLESIQTQYIGIILAATLAPNLVPTKAGQATMYVMYFHQTNQMYQADMPDTLCGLGGKRKGPTPTPLRLNEFKSGQITMCEYCFKPT